ncbi:ATP-binding protein [Ktedonobacter racemifer]|uniref:histidine kinase n=1 Tax=Ktedonobacter racemifer DSM 44963 TaxID=485913 RepID=D6TC79_KTERA|nr:ATP-binding protein [Ktedonobacter racemifer]EFH88115.1 PAS/PAC sensor signal transduction histidine kinase [Ktedonobacter racemifer DSM 44963]
MLHEPYGESQQRFGRLDGLFAKNQEARDFLAQAILDSVTVMMAVLDTNGRVHIVNEAWRRQARESCSPDQLARTGIGMNYLDVCKHAQGTSAEEAPEAFAGIEAVLGGRQSSFTLEYPCFSSARQSWYLMSVTPLPGNAGAVVAHIDITERKELEQRKDEFISIASHELKSPLTALTLLSSHLRKKLTENDSFMAEQMLTRMEGQVRTLTCLINDLLDVSKIQAGRLGYAKEPFDLDALINEIVETAQLTSPGHRLMIHGASHATISGDRDKLGQVFINLLSNAIKYSPQADHVDISLETVQDGAFVRIQDVGIGIPKERQDRLFERFYRVDTSKQNDVPGLGLGLYIAREIIKHHGGEITVSSEEGKGSIFSVSLPLHVSAT